MMFKQTDLWRKAFAVKQDHVHRASIQRLEATYNIVWNKAIALAALVAQELPGLTLHDERHFEALWRVADIIEGPQSVFNPLEVFIFGCSILIHDLAHTVRTFAGGLAELEQTSVWKDVIVSLGNYRVDVPHPNR